MKWCNDDYVSIVALIVSVISLIITISVKKKIARKTLSKDYFDRVFSNIMFEIIPQKIVKSLELKNGRLKKEIERVEDVILEALETVRAYQYLEEDFYLSFYQSMTDLESLVLELIELSDNSFTKKVDKEKYTEIRFSIDEKLKEIYDILKQEYMI